MFLPNWKRKRARKGKRMGRNLKYHEKKGKKEVYCICRSCTSSRISQIHSLLQDERLCACANSAHTTCITVTATGDSSCTSVCVSARVCVYTTCVCVCVLKRDLILWNFLEGERRSGEDLKKLTAHLGWKDEKWKIDPLQTSQTHLASFLCVCVPLDLFLKIKYTRFRILTGKAICCDVME